MAERSAIVVSGERVDVRALAASMGAKLLDAASARQLAKKVIGARDGAGHFLDGAAKAARVAATTVVSAVAKAAELGARAGVFLHDRAQATSQTYGELAGAAQLLLDRFAESVLGSSVAQTLLVASVEKMRDLAIVFGEKIPRALDAIETRLVPIVQWTGDQIAAGKTAFVGAALSLELVLAKAFRQVLVWVADATRWLAAQARRAEEILPAGAANWLADRLQALEIRSLNAEEGAARWVRDVARRADALPRAPILLTLEERLAAAERARDARRERGAGTPRVTRGVDDAPRTWLDEVLDWIADFGRSAHVQGVADGIGAILSRGTATLGALAAQTASVVRGFAQSLARFGADLAPLAASSAAFAEGWALLAGNVERVAQTSSAFARISQRARMVTLAALATIRASIEIAQGIAALVAIPPNLPTAALHFASAGLFGAAAGFALAGGGAVRGPANLIPPEVARPLLGGGGAVRTGDLTIVVRGSAFAADEGWVRTHLLEPIASAGARRPPTSLVTDARVPRIDEPDLGDVIVQALRGVGSTLLESFLINIGYRDVGRRVEREVSRTARRVGREARRIRRRLGL